MARVELPISNVTQLRQPTAETVSGPEKLGERHVNMFLLGMQGEGGFSGHDPIGLGAVARQVKADHGVGVTIKQRDTQPELARTGKIDTDALARELHAFATAPGDANKIIAVGAPIFSINYLRSTMAKYDQLCEENPPTGRVDFVMGGAIPTHTDTELLRAMFPEFKFVRGEGEERLSEMVGQSARNETIVEREDGHHDRPELDNYPGIDRTLTYDILHVGGMPKAESSRGCRFGNCKFCSREAILGRGGRDFRPIPAERVVEEVKTIQDLLAEFSGAEKIKVSDKRFEFADEDAFSDIEHTQSLISALKTEQMKGRLHRIPFGASMRVDTILALDKVKDETGEVSLLDQLREVGLDKVFLGVEGGSNAFLNQVAKGQSTEKIMQAISVVNKSNKVYEKDRPLEFEMGYITFAYNMKHAWLKENVQFLSMVEDEEGETESTDVSRVHAKHVSSLFNNLEVRAGTTEARLLVIHAKKANDPEEPFAYLAGYKPEDHFNINSSEYTDVPFADDEVKRIYDEVTTFAKADASLYYAVKSAVRADGMDDEVRHMMDDYYMQMKGLHLQFLRNEVGLTPVLDQDQPVGETTTERSLEDIAITRKEITETRQQLINAMNAALVMDNTSALDGVRREINTFMSQSRERDRALDKDAEAKTQRGALAVIRDEKDRILLVRASGQDTWTFPGGNIHAGERKEDTLIRELKEEGGLDKSQIQITRELRRVDKIHHEDMTTGVRPKLILSHFEVQLPPGTTFDHIQGDFEIADKLYLTPEQIMEGTVQVAPNVISIVQDYIYETYTQSENTQLNGEITFAQ